MYIMSKQQGSLEICELADLAIDSPSKPGYRLMNTSVKCEPGRYGYHGQILAINVNKVYLEALMIAIIEHALRGDKLIKMDDIKKEVDDDVYSDE